MVDSAALRFVPSAGLSLGVELELQLVDRVSRDLFPAAPQVLNRVAGATRNIKPEFFRSMIEVSTGVCANAAEARRDLEQELALLRPICQEMGLALVSAGSHPFARHRDRLVYPDARYEALIDRNRWVARRFQVFGMHVHVGMRTPEHAAAIYNGILPYLPHALALSASSPFWQGGDTGLASCRVTVYETLPTAGHPCMFRNWAEFEELYRGMVASGAIRSIKDIWWDLRPHPDYGTVEVRICDALPRLSEVIAVVALLHSLAAWLDEQYRDGRRFDPPPYWLLRENKWRALRWGLEAELVLDASGRSQPLREAAAELISRLEPAAGELGCSAELRQAAAMLDAVPSYQRQRDVFQKTGSLEEVVDTLVQELETEEAS
jgi:carboxylate-amine ligase